MLPVGMMDKFEREVEGDVLREIEADRLKPYSERVKERNQAVKNELEYFATLAKQAGVFDQEKYDVAVKYCDKCTEKGEWVYYKNSPAGEFIDDVEEKVKQMSSGKKM